jgi:hypothetical protein
MSGARQQTTDARPGRTTTTDRPTTDRPTTDQATTDPATTDRPTTDPATTDRPTTDPATVAAEVRTAVLGVSGVTGLSPGTGVEVATQFAGGKIVGIRLGDPVEVHVEIGPVPIEPVAEQIRGAVRDVLGRFGQSSSVEVVVEDVDLPLPVTPAAGS